MRDCAESFGACQLRGKVCYMKAQPLLVCAVVLSLIDLNASSNQVQVPLALRGDPPATGTHSQLPCPHIPVTPDTDLSLPCGY